MKATLTPTSCPSLPPSHNSEPQAPPPKPSRKPKPTKGLRTNHQPADPDWLAWRWELL